MPTMKEVSVDELTLDLGNFRTVHQSNETDAINAIIAIKSHTFWALIESIISDGYMNTENILVLQENGKLVVKEGNRRIAALKLILRRNKKVDIPETYLEKINELDTKWRNKNKMVPCLIYPQTESATVDKIVSLIHAKNEKAGRDQWNAVAHARHARDKKGEKEIGLDLLEKYIKFGKNLSKNQAERWSGEYPLSVLDEAIQKIYGLLEYKTGDELVESYPGKHKTKIEKIIYDIGMKKIGFIEIRNKAEDEFFGLSYGIYPKSVGKNSIKPDPKYPEPPKPVGGVPPATVPKKDPLNPKSYALNDPKSVSAKLNHFIPRGQNREKVTTLLKEMKLLNIERHPHSFCFLLRSMFEVSAKAYCMDHKSNGGPSYTDNGKDKTLAKLLKDIERHMSQNGTDQEKQKILYGIVTEMAKPNGLLSVSSMNQLVHSPTFSIIPTDICVLFNNVFPMLLEMNR